MDQELQHKGKRIIPYMDSQTLQHNVDRVAQQISIDYKDKDPIFIGVLNGAFMFMADVIRKVDKNIKFEIDFIKLSSYDGQQSTGIVTALSGIKANIKGRHVIIIEDIVETGITITHVIAEMLKMGPADVKLAACFLKKNKQKVPVVVDYLCSEIDDYFIVGYGLDWDEYGRGLDSLYRVE